MRSILGGAEHGAPWRAADVLGSEHTRARYESKVSRAPEHGGCWRWMGRIGRRGYGKIFVRGARNGTVSAHKLSYLLNIGDVGAGLVLDHLCRNTWCVNPAHLEPVTDRENIMRGDAPGIVLHKTGLCRSGHTMAGDNAIESERANGTVKRTCRVCSNAYRKEWQRRRYDASGRTDQRHLTAAVADVVLNLRRLGQSNSGIAWLTGTTYAVIYRITRGISYRRAA